MVNNNFVILTGKLIEDITIVEGKFGKNYGVISLKVQHHIEDYSQVSSVSINRFDIFVWNDEIISNCRGFCKKGNCIDVKGILQNTQGIITINVYDKEGVIRTKFSEQASA